MTLDSKHLSLLILFLFYGLFLERGALGQTPDNSLLLSERVGAEIDEGERDYFGLFPAIAGYRSATAHVVSGDSVAFTIRREEAPDSIVVVSQRVTDELTSYMDQFERVYRRTRMVNWGLLRRVARPVRHMGSGVGLTVLTRSGDSVSGTLLFIDERVLVLSNAADTADQPSDTAAAIVLFPRQIRQIQDNKGAIRRVFGEILILGAGNEEVFRDRVIPELRSQAVLRTHPSPEVGALVRQAEETGREDVIQPAEPIVVDEAYVARITPKLHVTFSIDPFSLSFASEEYAVARGPLELEPVRHGASTVNASLQIAYSVGKRFEAGVGANYLASLKQPPSDEHTFEADNQRDFAVFLQRGLDYTGFVSHAGFVLDGSLKFVLKPYDSVAYLLGQPVGGTAPFDLRVSAGPSLALLKVRSGLGSAFGGSRSGNSGPVYVLTEFGSTTASNQTTLGGHVGLELDYYLNRRLSIGVATNVTYYPQVEVQDHVLYNSPTSTVVSKTLSGGRQSVTIASTRVSLGMHF